MLYENLLKELAQALERENIPYLVMGGQAVLLHGEPRLTRDIDVTLGLMPNDLDRVLRIVGDLGLEVLTSEPEKFTNETWVLPVLDAKSGIRVDFIFSSSAFESQAMKRAVPVNIKGTNVRFASAEDLIIQKIFAGRPRDMEDVRGILAKKLPQLDVEYIRENLREFDKALNTDFSRRFEEMVREQGEQG